MSKTGQENKIIIEDEAPETSIQVAPDAITLEDAEAMGMSAPEIEMGKKNGSIKEDAAGGKDEKGKKAKSDDATGDDDDDKGQAAGEDDDDNDDGKGAKGKGEFDKTEDQLAADVVQGKEFSKEDMAKYKNFTPNVKSLYFKQKKYRERAQIAEKQAQDYRGQSELLTVKERVSTAKLGKIEELLKGPEKEITIEAIERILGEAIDPKTIKTDPKKPLTQEDLDNNKKKEQMTADEKAAAERRLANHLDEQQAAGESKFGSKEFALMSDLADEVMKKDASGTYAQKMILAVKNFDPKPGEELFEVIHTLAKLHPDFQTKVKGLKKSKTQDDDDQNNDDDDQGDNHQTNTTKVKAEDRKKVERIIKNSEKRTHSASVSAGGRRTVSEEDLTADDARNISQAQWNALKPETRQRLLMGG